MLVLLGMRRGASGGLFVWFDFVFFVGRVLFWFGVFVVVLVGFLVGRFCILKSETVAPPAA